MGVDVRIVNAHVFQQVFQILPQQIHGAEDCLSISPFDGAFVCCWRVGPGSRPLATICVHDIPLDITVPVHQLNYLCL